jgi:hypothetical protein
VIGVYGVKVSFFLLVAYLWRMPSLEDRFFIFLVWCWRAVVAFLAVDVFFCIFLRP